MVKIVINLFLCFCFPKLQLSSIIMVQNGVTLFVKRIILVLDSAVVVLGFKEIFYEKRTYFIKCIQKNTSSEWILTQLCGTRI